MSGNDFKRRLDKAGREIPGSEDEGISGEELARRELLKEIQALEKTQSKAWETMSEEERAHRQKLVEEWEEHVRRRLEDQ